MATTDLTITYPALEVDAVTNLLPYAIAGINERLGRNDPVPPLTAQGKADLALILRRLLTHTVREIVVSLKADADSTQATDAAVNTAIGWMQSFNGT